MEAPEPIELPSPDDPAEALPAVVALRRAADRLENAAVESAIEQGWTWTRIAQTLGVSRQAVHKRHRKRLPVAIDLKHQKRGTDDS